MRNTLDIKQDLSQNRQAFVLVQSTSIQAVRLAGARIVRTSAPDDIHGSLETTLSFKEGAARQTVNALQLSVEFEFSIREGGERQSDCSPRLTIECSFEALYTLRPDFKPTDEQISAFHASNAIFTCWPYFREFIQNTALRMHFPPPPVPFLLLTPRNDAPPVESPAPLARGSSKALKRAKKLS